MNSILNIKKNICQYISDPRSQILVFTNFQNYKNKRTQKTGEVDETLIAPLQ